MRQAVKLKLAICGVGLVAFAGVGLAVAGPSGRPLDRHASFQTGYGVDDLRGDCRLVEVADVSGKIGRALLAPCD